MTDIVDRLRAWTDPSKTSRVPIPAMVHRTMDEAADEIERLEDACVQLADCLRDLHDFQNGPPLPRYEVPWTEIMQRARALLKKIEGDHSDESQGKRTAADCG